MLEVAGQPTIGPETRVEFEVGKRSLCSTGAAHHPKWPATRELKRVGHLSPRARVKFQRLPSVAAAACRTSHRNNERWTTANTPRTHKVMGLYHQDSQVPSYVHGVAIRRLSACCTMCSKYLSNSDWAASSRGLQTGPKVATMPMQPSRWHPQCRRCLHCDQTDAQESAELLPAPTPEATEP